MNRRQTAIVLVAGAVIAAAAAAAMIGYVASRDSGAAGPGTLTSTSRFSGTELDPPSKPAAFALRDQAGKTVTLAEQRGRFVLVTFLYTHCPDVCPLIAANLNTALRQLGAGRAGVRVLAISVDPKGDTPGAVGGFVRIHRLLPQFRYLTGTARQLAPIWRGYHVAVDPTNLDTVDHSAYTLLVDREGRGRALYDSRVTAAEVVHDIRLLERT